MVLWLLQHPLGFDHFLRCLFLKRLVGLLDLRKLELLQVLTPAVLLGNRDDLTLPREFGSCGSLYLVLS